MAKTGDSCTFCGRGSRDVNMLINGISGAICDECAQQAYEIVKEQMPGKGSSFGLNQKDLPKPRILRLFWINMCRAGRRETLSVGCSV